MHRIIVFAIAVILFLVSCQPNVADKEPETGLLADSAMVVSAHQLASAVGKEILRNGGNVFDAAVATHFALAVVYPRAGNIGGGGFAVFRLNDGTTGTLDFREKAPKKAHKDMFLDSAGNVIDGKSEQGHLAIGVPGSVDGMAKLHERYGTMPWNKLVQPAIDLAMNGFQLNESSAYQLNRFQEVFEKVNNRKIYLNREVPWQEGDSIKHEDLAQTLMLIRDNGRAGFYEGKIADLILNETQKGNGIITRQDLADYDSKWRDALIGYYRGHKIIAMPPPSSGGIAVLQLLQGAEQFDFSKSGHNTPATIHKMIEIERRVYADRATHLGDPDYVDMPLAMLLSKQYNQDRFSTILSQQATPSAEIKEGNVEVIESVETTHYSIVDKEGNALAVTTTINSYFGSKVLVEGGGFFLNNEMDDFSAKPGVPNQFGLVGAAANKIEPEKRMLSSMTPTIVEKDNKVKMVVGTPGGSTIITSVYQVILNVIDHGMTMQQAVNAPKFHSQWLPDKVYFEEDLFDHKTIESLQQMGHEVDYRSALGKLECILLRADGKIEGAPDYTRNESAAAGY